MSSSSLGADGDNNEQKRVVRVAEYPGRGIEHVVECYSRTMQPAVLSKMVPPRKMPDVPYQDIDHPARGQQRLPRTGFIGINSRPTLFVSVIQLPDTLQPCFFFFVSSLLSVEARPHVRLYILCATTSGPYASSTPYLPSCSQHPHQAHPR